MSSDGGLPASSRTFSRIPKYTGTASEPSGIIFRVSNADPDPVPHSVDTFNNNTLPAEVLEILMEHVLSTTPQGTTFNLSALLTCQTWYEVGSRILWTDLVHRQNGENSRRTAQLTKAINSSQRAQEMVRSVSVSVTNSLPGNQILPTPLICDWHKIRDLLGALLHLRQIHTLRVDFGKGLLNGQVAAALQTLGAALPLPLQNLNIQCLSHYRVIGPGPILHSGLPVWSIDVTAQRLKSLRLEISMLCLADLASGSFSGYYSRLEDLAIILDGSEVSCKQAGWRHAVFHNVRLVSTALETAIEERRFPRLQRATISGAYVKKCLFHDHTQSPGEVVSQNRDVIFFRSFTEPPYESGFSYALLRLTPNNDIFWAQIALSWQRYEYWSKRRHFLHVSKIMRRDNNVTYMVVQVVDELPRILKIVRKGTWTELATGTSVPSSLLSQPEGRRYKRDQQPSTKGNNAAAAEKHHQNLMAKVAAYPDMIQFIAEQGNGTATTLHPKYWTD